MKNIFLPALLGALALSACGGGGGGNKLKLQFQQPSASHSYYQWDLPVGEQGPTGFNVSVRVTGSTKAPVVYAALFDETGWLTAGTEFQEIDLDVYQAGLSLPREVAPGTYTGTLKAMLCSDPGCTNVLTSDTLPYTVLMRANPTMTLASSAPVTAKALTGSGGSTQVVAFTLPEFTLQGWQQVPTQFRSFFYVRADDPDGRLELESIQDYNTYYFPAFPANGKFPVDFSLSQALPAGEYSGALTLRVCRDPTCLHPYTGSTTLPYTISVAANNLTALAPVAGAPEWQGGAGGNPAHSSYVPMSVDLAAFTPRFVTQIPLGEAGNGDLFTLGGRVFTASSFEVHAVNEGDGSIAWQKGLGGYLANPTAANGAVYVRSAYPGAPTLFAKLDAATGNTVFSQELAGVNGSVASLMAVGGNVLTSDWWYTNTTPNFDEQINLYDGQTGAKLAVPECLRELEAQQKTSNGFLRLSREPAIQGQVAYYLSTAGVEVVDFGEAQSCTRHAFWDMSTFGAPMLAPSGRLLVQGCSGSADNQLHGLSLAPGSFPWSAASFACYAQPASAAGVTYFSKSWWDGIEARNEATGATLWTFKAAGFGEAGSMLVTDNMLFFKSSRTYAFDLTTHRPVWSLSGTLNGPMALSPNGVLYVLNRSSGYGPWFLIAVNVR